MPGTGQPVDWLIEVPPRQGATPILRWRSSLARRTHAHHQGGSQNEACRMQNHLVGVANRPAPQAHFAVRHLIPRVWRVDLLGCHGRSTASPSPTQSAAIGISTSGIIPKATLPGPAGAYCCVRRITRAASSTSGRAKNQIPISFDLVQVILGPLQDFCGYP